MKRVTGTLLVVVLLALLIPAAVAADECAVLNQQIDKWYPWLAKPHYAGDKAHNDFLDELQKVLESDTAVKVDPQERSFTRWDPVEPTIEGEGLSPLKEQIWPLPYSGLTGPKGVYADLYYEGCVGFGWHFDAKKHAGKIVVLKVKPSSALKPILSVLTKQAIPTSAHLSPGEYRRAVSFERQIPSLQEAQFMGVLGVIVVFDGDPKISQDQYVPFTRALNDVPAVYIDETLGKQLIPLAKKGGKVRLRHYGSRYPKATTRHLLVTLPAVSGTSDCLIQDEAIVISTHTDGPNWFEDNGPVALLALLDSLKKETCRPRKLIFVFAAAHLAHEPGSNDDIVRRNPVLFAKARAAVVIEHLGALRYGKDGESEPMLVLTTAHDKGLNRLATQVVKADKSLRPVHIFWPCFLMFGEGAHLEAAGIPTIGFLTNPAYLLQEYKSWHDDWFSAPLMCDQVGMFRELIKEMLRIGPQDH